MARRSDRMRRATITNSDSMGGTPPSAKDRLLSLNKEVVECRVCSRLVNYRDSVAKVKKKQFLSWDYWGRPDPGFGDIKARIILIGLAPAPHVGYLSVEELTWGWIAYLSGLADF